MRFLILIVFFFVLYTNSYGITKEYNLIDKKLIIFTNDEISNDLDDLIEKKFDAILSVIDVNESDSFVSRFNELERNSQVSAPDYFVDAFLILKNYNKISKGSFDPTIFSIISKSKKVKKITKLLNTSSTRRCISMNNIKVKASNIFFKAQECTKLSFDSVISGIVVENLKSLLVNNNISNFSIIYNGTISNFNQTLDIKNYFDLQGKIYEIINFENIPTYSIYTFDNEIKTYHINQKNNQIVDDNSIFILVASDSIVNNDILSKTLNLSDFTKLNNSEYINVNIPVFISFKVGTFTYYKHSRSFEKYLN